MPKLDRDTFLSTIQKIVGEDTSDETLQAISDLTETYDSMNSDIDWEQRYNDNDKAWREKYRNRFFNPVDEKADPETTVEEEGEPKKLTFENLFTNGG